MELKSAWSLPDGKIFCICFSASPLWRTDLRHQRCIEGLQVVRHMLVHCGRLTAKGDFKYPLFLHCISRAWMGDSFQLGNWEIMLNFGSGIAKQEPRSFQGNLFHNLDRNVLASRLKLN